MLWIVEIRVGYLYDSLSSIFAHSLHQSYKILIQNGKIDKLEILKFYIKERDLDFLKYFYTNHILYNLNNDSRTQIFHIFLLLKYFSLSNGRFFNNRMLNTSKSLFQIYQVSMRVQNVSLLIRTPWPVCLMLSSLWKCEKEKEENTQLSGP